MLVSVYIPTKNRLELLKRAIQSVKEQTYKNIEIIVVDDGSTDGTREYLAQEMESGYLKAIFHEKSLGACAARNSAIISARGELVTGLDDDDYFLSNERIEFFVDKWRSASSDCAGIFDSVMVKTPYGYQSRKKPNCVNYQDLRRSNFVGNQICAPREYYINACLFDPEMPAWQDWDLWLRISKKHGYFINLNKYSYLVDEFHDAERITRRSESVIREAMSRLSLKINNVSLREKSSLIIAMHAYPQVRPTFKEVSNLIFALRFKSFIKSTINFLLR